VINAHRATKLNINVNVKLRLEYAIVDTTKDVVVGRIRFQKLVNRQKD